MPSSVPSHTAAEKTGIHCKSLDVGHDGCWQGCKYPVGDETADSHGRGVGLYFLLCESDAEVKSTVTPGEVYAVVEWVSRRIVVVHKSETVSIFP